MRIIPKSLRVKAILGYAAGIALTFGIALMGWTNLNAVDEMVASGEIVTELFDTALEIKRFEKNYFLYAKQDDLNQLVSYVRLADKLSHKEDLLLFSSYENLVKLQGDIDKYVDILKKNPGNLRWRIPGNLISIAKSKWARQLRDQSHIILDGAKQLSENRKVLKRQKIMTTKMHFLYSIATLVLLSIIGSFIFYRKAILPLAIIERHMNRISDGALELIDTKFKESELVSLKIAFNKMLQELQLRQSHIIQSEKLAAIGTLVFGVAHELNNPLSNISTSCQILQEEIDSDDRDFKDEMLRQISDETDRARDVVRTLLDYSRSKDKKIFSLAVALQETIRLVKAEIPAKISIITNVPDDITLFGDKQKIQQVFINLIKNSSDAIREMGEISIEARQDAKHVEIIFQDNGYGMDQSTLSKAFDPFFSSKTDKKGYGLGLFIVHNIINEHGGRIDVDSDPDKGTIFTITLPLEEE